MCLAIPSRLLGDMNRIIFFVANITFPAFVAAAADSDITSYSLLLYCLRTIILILLDVFLPSYPPPHQIRLHLTLPANRNPAIPTKTSTADG